MTRWRNSVLLVILLGTSAGAADFVRPAGAADDHEPLIVAGFRALFTCSAHFFSGRPADDILEVELADVNDPALPPPVIDEARRIVSAESSRGDVMIAAFRDTMGCTLLPPDAGPGAVAALPYVELPSAPDVGHVDFPAGDRVALGRTGTARGHETLANVLDKAFDGNSYAEGSVTAAVIVVRDGTMLAERYRRGFGVRSGYRTWSTAKSITAAIVGLAVGESLLALDEPPPIPEWSFGQDPRQGITLQHLLWMSSGLYSQTSNTNAVYFGGQDAISSATLNPLEAPPGTRWEYANNDTLLLMRALRAALGDDTAYLRYPYEKLLHRIGMYHTRMETDHDGNFIASSQVYTTARDLARFGVLLSQDGVWQGERILPEGWVAFLRSPAPARPPESGKWGYGAQFWLLDQLPGIPAGTFSSAGNKGQFVTVVPNERLVIVRTGVDPKGVRFAQDRLTADVLQALR